MDIETPSSPTRNPFDDSAISDEDLYLKMKDIESEIEFLKL